MKQIDVLSYSKEILTALKSGVLITAKSGEKINPMTISWGSLGIEWNKLIFTTYVRTGRFTHKLLEESGEFTVNIPLNSKVGKILGVCGSKSGKDIDKVKELNLTAIYSDNFSTPGFKELPLTLECKVIYKQEQVLADMPSNIVEELYPQGVESDFHGCNRDVHTMFFGEIVGAYIIE